MGDETGQPVNQQSSGPEITQGAVAFLDILGFKGIWQSIDPRILTGQIDFIAKMVDHTQKVVADGLSSKLKVPIKSEQLNINLLSDTFIITAENPDLSLALFTILLASADLILHMAIFDSLKPPNLPPARPIFLRGAISTGWFYKRENTYIGEAIDDAAEWYAKPDFIGAVLTPRTGFYHQTRFNNPSDNILVMKHLVPTKNGKFEMYCVDWINRYRAIYPQREEDVWQCLRSAFINHGNISPDVAAKYANTVEFMEHCKTHGLSDGGLNGKEEKNEQ